MREEQTEKRICKKLGKEQGITLIALVITIVILIILAIVAISLVFGEGGLIERAEEGKKLYEKAQAQEQQELLNTEAHLNELLEGTGGSTPTPEPEVPYVGMKIKVELQNVKEIYRVMEKLNYIITIENTSSIELKDIKLSNVLEGAVGTLKYTNTNGGTLDETSGILTTNLQKGESKSFEIEYEVSIADAGASIFLESTVTTINPINTNKVITMKDKSENSADIEKFYKLTIRYLYEDGTTAAPNVIASYLKGESFEYVSPTIDGYTPDYTFVRTGEDGMPEKDIIIDVIYSSRL